MTEVVEKTKRKGGQKAPNGNWLVLEESRDDGCDGYIHSCGETILGARVAHPIHDGLFPLSGSGKCKYETVPYCPKCEEKPDFHGSPIKEDFISVRDLF